MIHNSLWLRRWLLHRLLKRQSLSSTVLFRNSPVSHVTSSDWGGGVWHDSCTQTIHWIANNEKNQIIFIPMGSGLFGRGHYFIFLPYFFFVGFSLHSRLPEIWLQRDPGLKPFIVFKKRIKKYHFHGQWSIWQGSLFYVLSLDFFQDFPFTQDF